MLAWAAPVVAAGGLRDYVQERGSSLGAEVPSILERVNELQFDAGLPSKEIAKKLGQDLFALGEVLTSSQQERAREIMRDFIALIVLTPTWSEKARHWVYDSKS